MINRQTETSGNPLLKVMNNSLAKRIFPGDAKVFSVTPLDKDTDNEYSVSNYTL